MGCLSSKQKVKRKTSRTSLISNAAEQSGNANGEETAAVVVPSASASAEETVAGEAPISNVSSSLSAASSAREGRQPCVSELVPRVETAHQRAAAEALRAAAHRRLAVAVVAPRIQPEREPPLRPMAEGAPHRASPATWPPDPALHRCRLLIRLLAHHANGNIRRLHSYC